MLPVFWPQQQYWRRCQLDSSFSSPNNPLPSAVPQRSVPANQLSPTWVIQRVTTHFVLASAYSSETSQGLFKQLLPLRDTFGSQLHSSFLWCTRRTLKTWRRHLGKEDQLKPAITFLCAWISSILTVRKEESYPSVHTLWRHHIQNPSQYYRRHNLENIPTAIVSYNLSLDRRPEGQHGKQTDIIFLPLHSSA